METGAGSATGTAAATSAREEAFASSGPSGATLLEDPAALYLGRKTRFEAELERLRGRSRLLSNLRGLSFGVAVVSAIAAVAGGDPSICVPLAAVAGVAFIALLVVHSRVIAAEDLADRRVDVNRAALARLAREFQLLPDTGEGLAPPEHPYAADIDVFGQNSLFQRVSVARTRFGRERLAELLLSPASLDEARRRQRAVRTLAADLDLRQDFEAHALGVSGGDQAGRDAKRRVRTAPNPEPLLRWAESEPALIFDPVTVWGARLLPPVTLAAVIGNLMYGTPGWYIAVCLALQGFIMIRGGRDTQRVFTAVSATEGAFLQYGTLLGIIERLSYDEPLLAGLRDRLRTTGGMPSVAMKRFQSLVGWFDLRHNGLVHPFANLFLLWDIHCTVALERWQQRTGKSLRDWFDVIGWFEALSSLAAFAGDEPGLSYPELSDGPAVFEATELSHPLLNPSRRVANDVRLRAPGTALLITGSNMSGKSTLLRAMGTAAVLALAGAPVTARRLKISKLQPFTSIRVADSLERGISHFYAEITRLKAVVDAAHRADPVLFLLDEILHGTNSRERQIGARWVLTTLLRQGALGALSTHDEELCKLPGELMDHVELVHLRENVVSGKMTFDYRVYPGPVTSGNALRLMQIVGLDVPISS